MDDAQFMKQIEYRTLEEDLVILLENSRKKPSLSVKEILDILSGKGRSIILIFLSLPFCQPIQLPGLSIPFGIVIAFIGFRFALGKKIWLPKRILLKEISAVTIEKIVHKSLSMMKIMRRFIRSRFNWFFKYKAMQIANGLLIFLLGIFLMLPLPIPFTNLAAGWSLFLLNLGLLEDDGIFVVLGYLAFLLTFLFFFLILFHLRSFFVGVISPNY